tara:strand:- start:3097 stop:3354 length:258 start_codon:yes stop_codon:yes gene_type:complete
MGKINNETTVAPLGTDKVLGSDQSASGATVNYTIDGIYSYYLTNRVSVPSTAGATGAAGDYAVASGFAYFCVATNTWQRVAIATW